MSGQPRRPDDIGSIVNAIRQIPGHLDRYSKELSRSLQITAPQLGVLHVVNRYPQTTMGETSCEAAEDRRGHADPAEADGRVRPPSFERKR